MTRDQFHNGLRLLHSIDSHEIGDPTWYLGFVCKPAEFFIRCDDDTAALIWEAMEKRAPKKEGGDHITPPIRMDQSMSVAAVMVARLIGTFGKPTDSVDDLSAIHLCGLSVFLYQLLNAAKHKGKVVGILNALIAELKAPEATPS